MFKGCSALRSIALPNVVTKIDSYAFYGCKSLASISFGDNSLLTTISSYAFYECSSLTSVTMPSNLATIGSSAFAYCSSIETITLNDNIKTIGQYAFMQCDSLTGLILPRSLTSVGFAILSGSDLFIKTDTNTDPALIYCRSWSKPSGWDGSFHHLGADADNNNLYATVSWFYMG